MPYFSVIIPVYNAERYLRETLDSLTAQTAKDFEALLIDDGSKDSSPAICDEYAARDSRFHAVHKPNGGVSSARNLGMAQAQGEWIIFVDADDLLTPRALEVMLTVADDETDYVVGSVEKFGDVPAEVILQLTSGRSSESMDRVLCPASWAQLFRRNIIADSGLAFREDLSYSEDTLFVYTYRHHIRQLATVEDVVYRYRINADSATFSPNLMKRATHHMIVANAFQQMIEQNTDPKAVETLTFVRNKILRFVQNETEQVLQKQKI